MVAIPDALLAYRRVFVFATTEKKGGQSQDKDPKRRCYFSIHYGIFWFNISVHTAIDRIFQRIGWV
jgi:hypothetical protein